MTLREQAERDGYALVKGLSVGMDTLEELISAPPSEVMNPQFEAIRICRDGCAFIAHELCGPDLADTKEAVVHHNPTRIYDQWHYDYPFDGDRVIPLWRFAFYFRDYTTHSGALSVIPGSHIGRVAKFNSPAYTPSQTHVIQSQPGDLVIWNLRTLHKPNTQIGDLSWGEPRNAIIFDYAAPSPELDRYIAWRLPKRQKEGRQ